MVIGKIVKVPRTFGRELEDPQRYKIIFSTKDLIEFQEKRPAIVDLLAVNDSFLSEELQCTNCGNKSKEKVITVDWEELEYCGGYKILLSNGWLGLYYDSTPDYDSKEEAFVMPILDGFMCPNCVKEYLKFEEKAINDFRNAESFLSSPDEAEVDFYED